MDEMDDVLRELEDGKNPMDIPEENAKPAFQLRSLYAVVAILFLIAVTAWAVGNNVVFSAIAAASAFVGVLLLSAVGLLRHMSR